MDAGQDVPRCSRCRDPAVLFQRQSGRHLCSMHAITDICDRVAATIREERMIVAGDRVAVALSGGKDSTALLMILSRLMPAWEGVSLVAITIDEGIAGYRDETVRSADSLVHSLGVEHHNISFADLFGNTLDELLKGREKEACTVCGILRKKALVTGAERAGATKLATGHNLDDEAQSVLMNVLRGDFSRLVRNSGADSSGRFIPRIKPLMGISEKEIATYLLLNNAWTDLPECPYSGNALRRGVRSMLSTLEYRHPGTMLHLMESKKKIERDYAGADTRDPIRHCRVCGDPCSGELCQLCLLKKTFRR
ncbi:TIGR00269 family protein [uncultured Methanoregula sp.]|uniref:TIGR00269 family protein n=1 Tax=uncultured Methanoregula sp. TaxID=1005933 RepID=UPI002AAB4113|nr:TIGR00269 family protein [uncultured Methanoregula sp.]